MIRWLTAWLNLFRLYAWDGSGNFTRTKDWTNDRDNSIKILATRHDENDDELTTGIGACLTKNNESKPTADFRPNADGSYDLGSTSLRWRTAYVNTSYKIRTSGGTATFVPTTLTSDRTYTFPDATGNVMLTTSTLPGAQVDVHGTTAETAPATDDEAILYDTSAAANRRMTLANLLKVLNGLTEDTSPDTAADFVLTYDTSASAVKKAKPQNLASSVAGASLVFIKSQTAAGSATIDFINGASGVVFDGTYDAYVIKFYGVQPATNGTTLGVRITEDGVTFKSGASDYVCTSNGIDSAAGAASVTGSKTNFQITSASSNAADQSHDGEIWFNAPSDATHKKFFYGAINYYNGSNYVGLGLRGGYIGTTNAYTGVRFLFAAGNITAGTFVLYGVRKS